jgi:phytoene/squalene synthetase
VQVQDVIGSFCDPEARTKICARFALLKHGEDVRDAWVRDDLRKAELGAILGEIKLENDAFATSSEAMRICRANALAVDSCVAHCRPSDCCRFSKPQA